MAHHPLVGVGRNPPRAGGPTPRRGHPGHRHEEVGRRAGGDRCRKQRTQAARGNAAAAAQSVSRRLANVWWTPDGNLPLRGWWWGGRNQREWGRVGMFSYERNAWIGVRAENRPRRKQRQWGLARSARARGKPKYLSRCTGTSLNRVCLLVCLACAQKRQVRYRSLEVLILLARIAPARAGRARSAAEGGAPCLPVCYPQAHALAHRRPPTSMEVG